MESYGQKEPMENEAMARTLDAQARAIWPQEREIVRAFLERPGLDILDVGCGTGEISRRILEEFTPAHVTGIDLSEVNLRRARKNHGDRPDLTFIEGNAAAMPFPADRFDVALCRHMLQAIPMPLDVVREMLRVVKVGGTVYALAEDYGMLFFHPTRYDADEFWREYAGKAAHRAGSNLRQGRTMPAVLEQFRCTDIRVTYLVIDTIRVDRELVAMIYTHWRDGFAEWIASFTHHDLADVLARFDDMIASVRNPEGYAAWLIPAVSGRVTGESKERITDDGR